MAEQVAQWCRTGARLLWQELRDLYGHVSGRRDAERFALAMVRVPDPPAAPDAVLEFDLGGRRLAGEGPAPNELAIHTAIYRARPDVQAVVHCHPAVATALSATGHTVRAITHQSARFGDGIPLFRGDFITDDDIGRELAAVLGTGEAVLLRGHGVVVTGPSVPEAVALALILERSAQQQVAAAALGPPAPLPPALRQHPLHASPTAWFLWRQLIWEREGQAPLPPRRFGEAK